MAHEAAFVVVPVTAAGVGRGQVAQQIEGGPGETRSIPLSLASLLTSIIYLRGRGCRCLRSFYLTVIFHIFSIHPHVSRVRPSV